VCALNPHVLRAKKYVFHLDTMIFCDMRHRHRKWWELFIINENGIEESDEMSY
jgi:hypothetical protein